MTPWGLAAAAIIGLVAPAAAQNKPPGPAAKAQAHSVSHPGERVTVRVPRSATYVGSDRFDLYGVADAEVHVFAEAGPKKRLKKLYWIQFESYLPSKPELTHDYTDNRKAKYWGTTTWVRAGPASTAGPSKPGSDREHVQAILERAGYTIPAEVMNVRLVQLLDDPKGTGHGRRELMLIYSEDLAPTGKTLKELSVDGKPSAAWAPLEPGLVKRATTQFSVERK